MTWGQEILTRMTKRKHLPNICFHIFLIRIMCKKVKDPDRISHFADHIFCPMQIPSLEHISKLNMTCFYSSIFGFFIVVFCQKNYLNLTFVRLSAYSRSNDATDYERKFLVWKAESGQNKNLSKKPWNIDFLVKSFQIMKNSS